MTDPRLARAIARSQADQLSMTREVDEIVNRAVADGKILVASDGRLVKSLDTTDDSTEVRS
jgi:hypothetical protein